MVARQTVAEKLQLARLSLPENLPPPTLAPQASVMGEIMFIALTSDSHTGGALRTVADWTIRRRILATPGVAEALVIGGEERQFQIVVQPERLAAYGVTIDEVLAAARETNGASSEGLVVTSSQEYAIQGLARAQTVEDIGATRIADRGGVPVTISDIADVRIGAALSRGQGSYRGSPAVVIGVAKQPGVDTIALTGKLDGVIRDIQAALPKGMKIQTDGFRQIEFINTSILNLEHALRDGAILVVAIVGVFLLSARATGIAFIAIPVSILVAAVVLQLFGVGINTMTLGGLAIALGALVDDAIIVVENAARRLRENAAKPPESRLPINKVVFAATREIQSSILFATLIILIVFLPLFALPGVEGRLLQPLALAYIVALAASLLVAVTLTPALCALLLPGSRAAQAEGEGPVSAWTKRVYEPLLDLALPRWRWSAILSAGLLVLAGLATALSERAFLPEFNEGSFTVSAVTIPGTSLAQSDELGRLVERTLLEIPEIRSTTRRTGRAELDAHAQGVEASEIDVTLNEGMGRDKEEVLAEMRARLSAIPGMNIVIGQPISHRIDHMLSGTRAAIAIKVFGSDLASLRRIAAEIETVARTVPGVADLAVEPQVEIPTYSVRFDRAALAQHGLTPGAAAHALDVALAGEETGVVQEGLARVTIAVRFPKLVEPSALNDLLLPTPEGNLVPLSALGAVVRDIGPNMIARENGERRIVIMANAAGRDLVSVVEDLQQRIGTQVRLPDGYRVEYGGQFESAADAAQALFVLSLLVIAAVYALLHAAFHSWRDAGLVMLNLPLSLVGGVVGMWVAGGVLSVATLVGFITLFGVATRNGVMLVSHIRYLAETGVAATLHDAVRQGARERVVPIMMTALSAALGLLPLAMAMGEPGSEIQAPMAIVILFGLVSSTLLNMIVVPALYARFGAVKVRGA
jgi:CzcA family heavy metal efflux pump